MKGNFWTTEKSHGLRFDAPLDDELNQSNESGELSKGQDTGTTVRVHVGGMMGSGCGGAVARGNNISGKAAVKGMYV